jgi:hypothetical protein
MDISIWDATGVDGVEVKGEFGRVTMKSLVFWPDFPVGLDISLEGVVSAVMIRVIDSAIRTPFQIPGFRTACDGARVGKTELVNFFNF